MNVDQALGRGRCSGWARSRSFEAPAGIQDTVVVAGLAELVATGGCRGIIVARDAPPDLPRLLPDRRLVVPARSDHPSQDLEIRGPVVLLGLTDGVGRLALSAVPHGGSGRSGTSATRRSRSTGTEERVIGSGRPGARKSAREAAASAPQHSRRADHRGCRPYAGSARWPTGHDQNDLGELEKRRGRQCRRAS